MQSDPRRAPGLRTIAVVTVGSAFLSAGAHAQDGESREPGTLNKAYEALVGDGTEVLRVDQPEVNEPRPTDPLPAVRPETGDWTFDSRLGIEQYGALDPSGAEDFLVRRSGVDLRATRQGVGDGFFGARLAFEASTYEFDDVTSVAPGVVEPVQDALEGRFDLLWRSGSTDTWSPSFAGSIYAAGESEADFSDSVTWSATAAVTYRIDEDFAIVGGVLVRAALEDDPLVLPILGVEWEIDERSRVRTRIDDPTIEYQYDLQTSQSLFGLFGFRAREIRLDGQGPLPGAALSDRELRLAGGYEFRPGVHDALGLSDSVARIYVGGVVYQDLAFHGDDESNLFSLDQDPTLLFGASLRLTF